MSCELSLFLRFLKIHLPQDRKWVITADRGFGNHRNMSLCQRIGFDYVLRVKGDIRVSARGRAEAKGNKELILDLLRRSQLWFVLFLKNII